MSSNEGAKGADGSQKSGGIRGGAGTDPTPASRDNTKTGLTQDPEPANPAQEAAANAPDFMKGKPGDPPKIFASLEGLKHGSFAPAEKN